VGRRTKDEGSIYKRKDGRWCGMYIDANGKSRYVFGKTRAEVRAKLTKAIAEKDSGVAYDAGTLTFGDYLDKWLETTKGTVRERTWVRAEVDTRLHLKPSFGKVRLSRLNALQLQNLYGQNLHSGLSPRTVQIIHATAHKALKQAVAWSLIPRNVAEAVKPPKVSKREIQALDREQVKSLLKAARGDKLEVLYVVACTTAMRNGEILGLKWSDIDVDAGTLRVNRTVFNGKVNPPKTSNGRRTIRLSQLAISALKRHRTQQAQQRISE
jgi:integrase